MFRGIPKPWGRNQSTHCQQKWADRRRLQPTGFQGQPWSMQLGRQMTMVLWDHPGAGRALGWGHDVTIRPIFLNLYWWEQWLSYRTANSPTVAHVQLENGYKPLPPTSTHAVCHPCCHLGVHLYSFERRIMTACYIYSLMHLELATSLQRVKMSLMNMSK